MSSNVLSTPPLTRIEQYHCPRCGGWVDPQTVINRPFGANESFWRFLFLECEHCAGAWLFWLAHGDVTWNIDQLHDVPQHMASLVRSTLRNNKSTFTDAVKLIEQLAK